MSLPFNGFLEYSLGSRIVSNDQKSDDMLLNEATFRMEFSQETDIAAFNFKGGFRYDNYLDDVEISVREATIDLYAYDSWELKAGHQVLTWGTGDLVFINDLFPKDWKSFFLGREDEYLKAPSTSMKFSFFSDFGDFNLVVTPIFTPDTYLDGERFTYWGMQGITGEKFQVEKPDETWENAEFHGRFAKNISGVELALYGYKGFFKRPLGFDPAQGLGIFPELAVYGASLRTPLFGGIFNLESGYYDSLDDDHGTDPMLENSIWKNLVGFEKELMQNLTVGLQYFSEWMQDYEEYENSVEAMGQKALKEENHDWITLRLTNLRKQQTVILSFFGYYSPSENDWYLKPSVTYKMSDNLQIAAGANLFFGENDYTFFGQLEDNSNLYARIRYSF
ncbi:hypothetical protein CSA56_16230 [candidate division KSB3 bacterium]|uniref:Uncharacterized protein n=1 Tax=candidate division KSB3 bacterium TaxID=2044937 RepID=A0A2G6K8Y0_9BACT|nr:MAG: hypothetical protein CSA56_16230 [candidate division KSB3 bacterium]